MIRKYVRMNRTDLLIMAWVQAGIFLLTHIITIAALLITGEQSSILLSGTLLPIAGGIIILVIAGTTVLTHFDHLLSFSCTRKRALGSVLGYLGGMMGVSLVMSWALTALERAVFPNLWKVMLGFSQLRMEALILPEGSQPPAGVLFVEDFGLVWWAAPLILLGGAMIGLAGGAVIRRFGKKGGWVIWALYMVLCLFVPNWLQSISSSMAATMVIVAGLCLVLSLIWAVWDLLHGPIRR